MPSTKKEKAIKQVLDAWRIPGPKPAYHEAQKMRLWKEWPSLYFALKELIITHSPEATKAFAKRKTV